MMDGFFSGHMYGYGWGILNFIGVIIFWVFIILSVIWVVRELSRNKSKFDSSDSGEKPKVAPLDILKERFAKGEITKKEFEEKRGLLE